MSVKEYDALEFPSDNPDQVSTLTPRINKNNKDTKYVDKRYLQESDDLAVENFGFNIGGRSKFEPINVKKFNTATFDANKGMVKTDMAADNSGKLDASKPKLILLML